MPDIERQNISLGKLILVIVFIVGTVVPSALTIGHYVQKVESQETRIARLEDMARQNEQTQRDILILLGKLEERLGYIGKKLE